ncbi:hypothetical protein SAMD00019534_068750 [Acytostelium subglobosum LB1]|uniref:hypothetical protein n=1 Tax=Acytostelium subglobosum LB1 TaxID=1410327 RepID=UPI00064494E7|nr:hypothetical protein SAMD00019534_068750 [Acytostelium subglobosum LB1]GAM23700.1 hypothetical protein SAMD00019534_068750 [Acytostelium subglobosum LB1]|eukprot:XP_012753441.1 hypothetical protein SAMD00019534_068750 [Acytostelium subglobosum LB1]
MRRLKRSLSITKQNLMEKTSNRTNTLEPEDMKSLERHLDDNRFHLRKVTRAIEKETVSSGVSIRDGTELADGLIDYSVHVKEEFPDMVVYAGILSKIGEFQAAFEDLKAKLNASLINEVSDPLKSLVKKELRDAHNSKREYDKVRVEYDASLSELNSLKKTKGIKVNKITDKEQECGDLSKAFELIGMDTAAQLQDTNLIAEFETIEKLCDYLDAYHTFFQKGYRWVAQMIPDIYEYRLYVDKRKSELEKSKVRMSMMLSPATAVNEAMKYKVFGEQLSVLVTRDAASIPSFISRAFQAIRSRLDEEGLFRVSGPKKDVIEFKRLIDEGKEYNLASTYDIHVVCSLVKLFLRELQPEPLLSYGRYNEYIDVCNIESAEERVAQITRLINTLPKHNYHLLHHLMYLLSQISTNPKNKMGAANLATVIGPNILVSQAEVVVEDIALGNMVITMMIQNFEKIFGQPPVVESLGNSMATSSSNVDLTKEGDVRSFEREPSANNLMLPTRPVPIPIQQQQHHLESQLPNSADNTPRYSDASLERSSPPTGVSTSTHHIEGDNNVGEHHHHEHEEHHHEEDEENEEHNEHDQEVEQHNELELDAGPAEPNEDGTE